MTKLLYLFGIEVAYRYLEHMIDACANFCVDRFVELIHGKSKSIDNNSNKLQRSKEIVKYTSYNATYTFDVFENKIAEYFPGSMDFVRVRCSNKATKKIEQFFLIPFKDYSVSAPILLRSGKTEEINLCQRLVSNYILINNKVRLKIKQIYVYRSNYAYEDYIYVEVKPDVIFMPKATLFNGIGNVEFGIIHKHIGSFQYAKLISREKYDDISGAQLRICMTKRNNYLIVPKDSVYNILGNGFDAIVDEKLDAILSKTISMDDFAQFMQSFAEEHRDDFYNSHPEYIQNL